MSMGKRIGWVFPGQGAQQLGMLSELAAHNAVIETTFEEASDAIGMDLWALAQGDDAEALNLTSNTQPALLAASVAVARLLDAELPDLDVSVLAGHSLGEYSALVCAKALPFAQAVKLVRKRGQLMERAVPDGQGGMAAILGLSDEAVRALCLEASTDGVVEAVNFNAPSQVVIAGEQAALNTAITRAKEQGAKRALALSVSGPFHSSLMRGAAEAFEQALTEVTWSTPNAEVIHNATLQCAPRDQLVAVMLEQLYSPVNWVATIEAMASRVDTLIEVGPGKVLTGLNKRIAKQVTTLPTDTRANLDAVIAHFA